MSAPEQSTVLGPLPFAGDGVSGMVRIRFDADRGDEVQASTFYSAVEVDGVIYDGSTSLEPAGDGSGWQFRADSLRRVVDGSGLGPLAEQEVRFRVADAIAVVVAQVCTPELLHEARQVRAGWALRTAQKRLDEARASVAAAEAAVAAATADVEALA